MTYHHSPDDKLAETCAAAVKAEFEATNAEIDAAQARLAHLTGICPQCGDAGWWIDDAGYHDCDCTNPEYPRFPKAGPKVLYGRSRDVGKAGIETSSRETTPVRTSPALQSESQAKADLLSAERNYDAARAEWQRELYLAYGKPGLSLSHRDKLAKGAEGSLLREKHTAYIAARRAYDDAGEELVDDMPDDERCGECDGLRGSCSWCQGAAIGDARRGEDYP